MNQCDLPEEDNALLLRNCDEALDYCWVSMTRIGESNNGKVISNMAR
jgi:hypothetical protein